MLPPHRANFDLHFPDPRLRVRQANDRLRPRCEEHREDQLEGGQEELGNRRGRVRVPDVQCQPLRVIRELLLLLLTFLSKAICTESKDFY